MKKIQIYKDREIDQSNMSVDVYNPVTLEFTWGFGGNVVVSNMSEGVVTIVSDGRYVDDGEEGSTLPYELQSGYSAEFYWNDGYHLSKPGLEISSQLDNITSYVASALVNGVAVRQPLLGKTILVTGDSISDPNVGGSELWYTHIASLSGCTVKSDGKSGTGLIRGYDGKLGIYYRIDDWVTDYGDFDAIVLMCNMNDGGLGSTVYPLGSFGDTVATASHYGAVHATLTKLITLFPTKPIVWLVSTPRLSTPTYVGYSGKAWGNDGWFSPFADAIVETCEHFSIPCLDLYHGSGLRPWNADNRLALFDAAGTHPNVSGNKVLGELINPFINDKLIGTWEVVTPTVTQYTVQVDVAGLPGTSTVTLNGVSATLGTNASITVDEGTAITVVINEETDYTYSWDVTPPSTVTENATYTITFAEPVTGDVTVNVALAGDIGTSTVTLNGVSATELTPASITVAVGTALTIVIAEQTDYTYTWDVTPPSTATSNATYTLTFAEPSTGDTIANMIVNGDMESGVTDFATTTAASTLVSDSTEFVSGSKSAKITTKAGVTTAIFGNEKNTEPITIDATHIYYARAMVKTSISTAEARLSLTNYLGGTTYIALHDYAEIGSTDWTLISGIGLGTSASAIALQLSVSDLTELTDVFVDDLGIVDLTLKYGSGNEPTLAWCDANITIMN